jgi:hypothetical protein
LACADALDTLLLLKIKVIIPDMVMFEVARHIEKPGAAEVMDWLAVHGNKDVFIGNTEEYREFKILLKQDQTIKTRNRGELAAGEILARELKNSTDAAILLFEDKDLTKANFLVRMPDNVLIMSTSAFLDGLQKKQLINNAGKILNRAVVVRGKGIYNRTMLPTSGVEELSKSWQLSSRRR